ncbi:MAG: hypothetical protein JNL63_09330 [Bacteroidia bacterium]|nr:hypothetical protein [Bacteroidia bacterium]
MDTRKFVLILMLLIVAHLLFFIPLNSVAQSLRVGTIRITYDTIANTPIREALGPIPNDEKTAFIGFDSGFENDSVEVWVNKKMIASGLMNSKLALGKAGGFQIPKMEKMEVMLVVKNKREKFEIVFDKKYCVAHLHHDAIEPRLVWTYSNQVYTY